MLFIGFSVIYCVYIFLLFLQILQGELGFITTLLEGRDQKKRPTEFKIDQVLQPFNKEKFNFTKVAQEEVIFVFKQNEISGTGYFECGPTTDGSYSPNAVMVNVRVYCITWDSSFGKSFLSFNNCNCIKYSDMQLDLHHHNFWQNLT